ncbi:hypothetical protein J451_09315 [Mannheimia haemolytica D174]|nr:hypothetical protein [Mannheimia haemolytica]AGQ41636.1 hypothetical protein J451_09315 [Mannheimia haemolytica D174]
MMRLLHIFILSDLLDKIGCNTYELPKIEDIHKYEMLSILKIQAAKENNAELRYYVKKKKKK